ncbi:MAG TPA: hypothetical protein VGP24_03015 [Glaciihabitans sp.]|nr:hypothetical protein [Glaciihabitans sp.]
MTAPEPTPAARRLMARASVLSDQIPTKWLISSVAGLALGVSALFGGLEDVEPTSLPELDAGETFTGAQLAIAVERLVLIDAFPEQGIQPEEGNRLLVVVATVENVWDKPVSTYNNIGAADNIRLHGIDGFDEDTPPTRVDVLSDSASYPQLQSGVPIELAYMWEVPQNLLSEGDDLQLDIYDKVYAPKGFVTYGERFDSPFIAATVTLPIDDVGAGTPSE